MTDTPKNLITRERARLRAGVGLRTIDRWLHDGRLVKYTDAFGRVRVDADELDRLIGYQPASPAVR